MSEQENNNKKEIDKVSGVETTGHEWDGLKELNNPLPRWWLWVFYACIIWSIWYFVVYPSWPIPGGATKGTSGYTQIKELEEKQNEILARQQKYLDKFETASFDEIMNDPDLYQFAISGGKAMFKDNCATCHGTGASGSKGYPNLNDDDWIWGGTLEEIETTLLYGIRSKHDDAKYSQMPAFGKDELLNSEEVNQVVDFVVSLSEGEVTNDSIGYEIYQTNCASCHGVEAKGDHDFGAPNLADAIWLYGGDRKDIYESVYYSRNGMMPNWENRLDKNTIRQLSVYVHQLGGGEDATTENEETKDTIEEVTEDTTNEDVVETDTKELNTSPADITIDKVKLEESVDEQ